MPSDLWTFTLDFYSLSGVEPACLKLQADGANVCALLYGVWLGARGVPCTRHRLTEVRQLAEPWHGEVVRPLRELRTRWKTAAGQNVALAALRERVKALELEAERQLLMDLQALSESWPITHEQSAGEWLAELAGDAGRDNCDALQVLRAAAGQA